MVPKIDVVMDAHPGQGLNLKRVDSTPNLSPMDDERQGKTRITNVEKTNN